MRLFWVAFTKRAGSFRFGTYGWGLNYTCNEPLFSERYGFRKPFLRLFGYRFFLLKPQRWQK